MDKIRITSKLNKLALRYDYTIVCDDIKGAVISGPDENGLVQRGIEMTNPIEYTRKELLEKYTGKEIVIKWIDTYTEKGDYAMAVVLEKKEGVK